jgi:methionyl-tRNA synthetase
VEARAPWKQAKNAELSRELNETLRSLIRSLAHAAVLLYPFMPEKMTSLWEQLGSGSSLVLLTELQGLEPAGWTVSAGSVLFPRPELRGSTVA